MGGFLLWENLIYRLMILWLIVAKENWAIKQLIVMKVK